MNSSNREFLLNKIRTTFYFGRDNPKKRWKNNFSIAMKLREVFFFTIVTGLIITALTFYYNYNLTSTSSTSNVTKSWVINHVKLPPNFKGKPLPFHQIYEPRKLSFDNYNFTNHNSNDGKPKIILLATPWNGVYDTINFYTLAIGTTSFSRFECPNSNCVVTKDLKRIGEADAVIFHLLDLPKTYPTTRHENQIWIAYIMEAPWLVARPKVNLTALNGVFNWTMSYRDDSDVRVKYGFVGRRIKDDSHSNFTKIPFNSKKPIVWFVSDCKVDSRREAFVKKLSQYISVDVYGRCGTKKCFPAQSSVCYEDILKSYKFYLSFENSICKDYVTEKYFNVLDYDVVPVVFGGADYERIGPPGGFIDATKYNNPKDLALYLNELANNENKYLKYLEWKSTRRAYLYPWMCYLCDKLHTPIKHAVKMDLKKWWMDDAQCKRWTNDGYVNVKY